MLATGPEAARQSHLPEPLRVEVASVKAQPIWGSDASATQYVLAQSIS